MTYAYDKTYQLTNEKRSGANAYNNTYTYDLAGNRTLKIEDGARSTYTYDAANQLETAEAAAGTTTYTFDANGNQEIVLEPSGDRTTNTWNVENQNTLVEKPDGSRISMIYNAENRRVEKENSSETVKFVWEPDTDNYLLETDGSDITQVLYTIEPVDFGRLISQRRAGASLWLVADPLGSTRQLTNASQVVSDSFLFDAFGVEIARTGSTNCSLRYVGELGYYFDTETDEMYIRDRFYIANTARWKSVDPLGLSTGDLNVYGYVNNSVTSFVDPSGNQRLPGVICGVIDAGWVDPPPPGVYRGSGEIWCTWRCNCPPGYRPRFVFTTTEYTGSFLQRFSPKGCQRFARQVVERASRICQPDENGNDGDGVPIVPLGGPRSGAKLPKVRARCIPRPTPRASPRPAPTLAPLLFIFPGLDLFCPVRREYYPPGCGPLA